MTADEKRQRELEDLGLAQDPDGYVMVSGRCWPLMAWVETLNRAVLDFLEKQIPNNASMRQAMRVIRDARKQWHLPEVWRLTVQRLEDAGVESLTTDEVTERGGVIAGLIPLDKANAPR